MISNDAIFFNAIRIAVRKVLADEDREDYWRSFVKRTEKYEKKFIQVLKKVFEGQRDYVLARLDKHLIKGVTSPYPEKRYHDDPTLREKDFNEDQPRDSDGKWTDTGGGDGGVAGQAASGALSDKAERAKASYKPATAEKQRLADANEGKLAEVLGGDRTADNAPFDVIRGKNYVECKTIIEGSNDKITMHPDALARKVSTIESTRGAVAHTVVFDERSGSLYYRRGVGSYALKNMTKVEGFDGLRKAMRIKA